MESIKWMIDEAMRVWQTKTALARHLGVTPQRLAEWERGARKMPAPKIEQLAALSGLSPALQIGRYELEWRKKKAANAVAGTAALAFFLVASAMALGPSDAAAKTSNTHILVERTAHYAQRRRILDTLLRQAFSVWWHRSVSSVSSVRPCLRVLRVLRHYGTRTPGLRHYGTALAASTTLHP